jgi:hypothetical protein
MFVCMGLTWHRKAFRDGWEGDDGTGHSFAHVVLGRDGRWGAFIPTAASGYADGLWLGGYRDHRDAMDAADRVLIAYVDEVGMRAVRDAVREARMQSYGRKH